MSDYSETTEESKLIHLYYNIGCKWRYKQMRYDQCNRMSKLREPLDRRYKSYKIELTNEFDINNNDINESTNVSIDGQLCCDYENCDRLFSSWFQLQRHRCKHNKNSVKPYDCDWSGCRNKFKKLKNLIIHRRLHTGERPFKCDTENCNKSFRAAHSLTTHRRSHAKE